MNNHGGECKCGRPTRDAAYVCDHCCDELARSLGDVPWLTEELEVTASRQRGIDYRGLGGGKGKTAPRGDRRIRGDLTSEPTTADSPSLGAAIQGDAYHQGASEARAHLRALLASWVRFCDEEGVRSSDHSAGKPADDTAAMSRWLMWRIDGLALHEIGPDAHEEIVSAVALCYKAIDNAPEKWFAGPCNQESEGVDCGADLYALSQKGEVRCHVCSATYDVAERRKWLLEAAEDRLADATQLARSVSWLGSKPLNRDRVYQWAKRGRIVAKTHVEGKPLYRIGDAIDLLAKEAS